MQNEKEVGRKKKNGHEQQPIEMLGIEADEIRERLATVDTQLRTMARERPLVVVCGALLVGYVLGRIVSR
ncbi:MAG: hypothetical protein ACAI38_03665 [Myxococcota bacterium]